MSDTSESNSQLNLYKLEAWQIEIYRLYREKVIHEDTLINFRTTWFIALQAFLFTSFSLSIGKFDADIEVYAQRVFGTVGLVISTTSFVSIVAAKQAIGKTARKWTEPYKDWEGRVLPDGVRNLIDPHAMLPAIKGAGSSTGIAFRGNFSSFFLPLIIGGMWGALLFVDTAVL